MAHRQWRVKLVVRATDSRTDFSVVPTESRTQSATAHSRDRYALCGPTKSLLL